jgi:hypothetical protein
MRTVAHRPQMRGSTAQSFFLAVEPSREQIPPESDTALAATEKAGICVTRILSRASEALLQALVGSVDRPSHFSIPHSQLPERSRRLLAEDMTR